MYRCELVCIYKVIISYNLFVHELFPKNVTSSQMALLLSKSALIADECFSSQGQQKRELISEIYGN